ncbi:MAG: hypothetical protein HY830_26940 [Actinobacteria bacterium]|nr:hypothetical protein [Actinomycetota bacterium]
MSQGQDSQEIDPVAAARAIARLAEMIARYTQVLARLQATRANPSDFSVLGAPAAAGQQAKHQALCVSAAVMLAKLVAMREALEKIVDSYVRQDESVAEILDDAQRTMDDDERVARARAGAAFTGTA